MTRAWVLVVVVVAGGCEHEQESPPPAPPAPAVRLRPATCVVEDGRRVLGADRRYDAEYRVDLATGRVAAVDLARDLPLDGGFEASVTDDRFVVRRDGRVVLEADAHGVQLGWQLVRDGVLYFALYHDGDETFQALRLASFPRVDTVWCRAADEPAGYAHATANGPLVLRGSHMLLAIDPRDGRELWRQPWPETGAPFSLRESGDNFIVCDRDTAAIDRATGAVRWRRAESVDTATDCALAGAFVWTATRRCGPKTCTETEAHTLDAATGTVRSTAPGEPYRPLVALDHDHAVVATQTGVAILDARDGTLGPELALAYVPYRAEQLDGGEVLLRSRETVRIGIAPLAVRWRASYFTDDRRIGDELLATRTEPRHGEAWLVTIDVATGRVREIALPRVGPPYSFGYEWGIAEILGTSAHEVDVGLHFGVYTR